jgi:hypothetical protein
MSGFNRMTNRFATLIVCVCLPILCTGCPASKDEAVKHLDRLKEALETTTKVLKEIQDDQPSSAVTQKIEEATTLWVTLAEYDRRLRFSRTTFVEVLNENPRQRSEIAEAKIKFRVELERVQRLKLSSPEYRQLEKAMSNFIQQRETS